MARIGSTAGDGCPALGDHLLGHAVLFGDGAELADSTAHDVGLALADGANVRVNKTLGEVVLGDMLRQPDVAFSVGKALADGADLGEDRAMAIATALTDGVTLADGKAAAVGKALTDGLELGDAVTHVWEAYLDLDDGVYVRDRKRIGQIMVGEILGEPDVDLAVGKAVADGVALGDAIVHAVGKGLSDGVEIGDALDHFDVGLSLADALAMGDSLDHAWDAYTTLSDGIDLSDAVVLLEQVTPTGERMFVVRAERRTYIVVA